MADEHDGGGERSTPADAGTGEAATGDAGDEAPTPGTDPGGDIGRDVTLDEEAFGEAYGGTPEAERNPEEMFQRPGQRSSALRTLERADLRDHYGPVRTWFKQREGAYTEFQRRLTQAWMRRTYDQYLASMVARMCYIAVAGVLVGLVAAGILLGAAQYGVLPAVLRGAGVPVTTLAAVVAVLSAAAGLLGAGAYWAWRRVLLLRRRIAQRRRNINYNLPYAVTFMYALSRAGVSFDRILVRLADSKETYGAVGQEFDRVVRDVEMFGNNVYTGLENLRSVTPSAELRRLTDEIMTILETGGDLSAFLREEIDTQLDTAVEQQEAFIERLELLSEIFVVGLVAAPLFVLVVLLVISFLGVETFTVMAALVYLIVPLALVAFGVFVDVVSEPYKERPVSFSSVDAAPAPPTAEAAPDWWQSHQRSKQLTGLRNRLRAQVTRIREDPWRALVFSVPVAVAVPVVGVLMGVVSPTLPALLSRPVAVTTVLAAAPLLVATTPVAVVYERRRRQELAFRRRFPDLLQLLAASNRRGLSLTRGLDIVTESTSGRLGEELRKLRNDIEWNADLPAAFEAFGDRLVSPTLTRTVNLVAEGSRATSDLHVVLGVAATDTAERARLRRERRQTLQSYLVIVVVGFLVYLLVVLLLAANFLEPIEAVRTEGATDAGPISLGDVPVDRLRVLLFHSALVQGFGSGVLAGKLAENSLYSGLKYGIGLVILTLVVFTVF